MAQLARATLNPNCSPPSTEGIMRFYPSTAGYNIYNTADAPDSRPLLSKHIPFTDEKINTRDTCSPQQFQHLLRGTL